MMTVSGMCVCRNRRAECEAEVVRWEGGREERRAALEEEEVRRLEFVVDGLRGRLAAWAEASRETIRSQVEAVRARLEEGGEEEDEEEEEGEVAVDKEGGAEESEAVRRLERAAGRLEERCARLSLELGRVGRDMLAVRKEQRREEEEGEWDQDENEDEADGRAGGACEGTA